MTQITLRDVDTAICHAFNVDPADIHSANRTARVAGARQAAFTLARKHCEATLQEIGAFFGGRDHSTVVNGINRTPARAQTSEAYARRLSHADDTLSRQWETTPFVFRTTRAKK